MISDLLFKKEMKDYKNKALDLCKDCSGYDISKTKK